MYTNTSTFLEVAENTLLLEWFANEYQNYVCKLEYKSEEGSEFYRGYGGIGGFLWHPLNMIWCDELSDKNEVHEYATE